MQPIMSLSRKATKAEHNYWPVEMEIKGLQWMLTEHGLGSKFSKHNVNNCINDGMATYLKRNLSKEKPNKVIQNAA